MLNLVLNHFPNLGCVFRLHFFQSKLCKSCS